MWALRDFKKRMEENECISWNPGTTIEFFWAFNIKASASEVWGIISDTSRFNRELGLSPRTEEEIEGKNHVSTTIMGMPQKWIEEPWSWIANRTIGLRRNYSLGIAKEVQSVFHISEEKGESTVYIYFGWIPKSLFWQAFLQVTGPILKNKFHKAFVKIETRLKNPARTTAAFSVLPTPLEKTKKKHLEFLKAKLLAKKLDAKIVSLLCRHVELADDLDLASIRIPPLAREWGLEVNQLLVVALHATREGLLNISWKVICPHCRGSRYAAGTLGEIPAEAECNVCEVTFSTGDEDRVEVFFTVQAAVREVRELIYCAAEPAKKSHIKVQQLLDTKFPLIDGLDFPEGKYRVRYGSEQKIFTVSHLAPGNRLALRSWESEASIRSPFALDFSLSARGGGLLVVEEMWWRKDILNPSDLLSLWEFRELFPAEQLQNDTALHLGNQAILFTDIVGSTQFYNLVGDSQAFAKVHQHFQELFAEVRARGGVVVKTIGDAVMASFPVPGDAVAAAVAIQEKFPSNREDTSIRLRISVHCGLVIAVRLNTGIDYFGSTVNLAAKIQSCAQGGEIALSDTVFNLCTDSNHSVLRFPYAVKKNLRDSDGKRDVFVVQVDVALAKAGIA
jgi:class 3 adenylate cyclase